MGLGIVSNEDFESELKNSNKEFIRPVQSITPEVMDAPKELEIITDSSAIIKRYHEHGRNEGDVNVPQSLRKLIGDAAVSEGRPAALELANQLGISTSSVSAYTHPLSSSSLSQSNQNDLFNVLTERKIKISKRALGKLNLAMNHITDENLKGVKPVDLSNIARNMAQVAKHMEPPVKDEGADKVPVQFLMYAPQINTENKYQTVVAKDNY